MASTWSRATTILWDARFRAEPGEVVALLGPNRAGKSTLMNSLSGLVRARSGRVVFRGHRIDRLPAHRIVGLGLAHLLERRRRETTRAEVEALFPRLGAPWEQSAHTLSGGAQQMVAIARDLMARPTLLMIDGPFLGLAPRVVEQISQVITRLDREHGLTIVFIEQLVLGLAHRGNVLESGRTMEGPSSALLQSAEVGRIFLGA